MINDPHLVPKDETPAAKMKRILPSGARSALVNFNPETLTGIMVAYLERHKLIKEANGTYQLTALGRELARYFLERNRFCA